MQDRALDDQDVVPKIGTGEDYQLAAVENIRAIFAARDQTIASLAQAHSGGEMAELRRRSGNVWTNRSGESP